MKETRGRKAGEKTLSPLQKLDSWIAKSKTKTHNYNYNITAVDQRKLFENRWDLDIIDMAIFNQMNNFINSGYADAEKITDSLGDWYFISEEKTIKDLPFVPINSKNAVYKRVAKLVEYGLIERHPSNRLTGRKYLRVTKYAIEKLVRVDSSLSESHKS